MNGYRNWRMVWSIIHLNHHKKLGFVDRTWNIFSNRPLFKIIDKHTQNKLYFNTKEDFINYSMLKGTKSKDKHFHSCQFLSFALKTSTFPNLTITK